MTTTTTQTTTSLPPSCPCCTFLPKGIFLPEIVDCNNQVVATSIVDPHRTLHEILSTEEHICLVDTHCHAHLERSLHESYRMDHIPKVLIVSLSCAVEPADWQACLDYASTSETIVPALGVHPWYLENLQNVYLETLERLLNSHPTAIVGEIGLCKVAKFLRTYPYGKAAALELQRSVFIAQLKLAAKYRRSVSVHCVDQHGVLMSVLEELSPHELPPKIAMHSFTGTAHHIQQLLKFESKNGGNTLFYFGFSHIVNFEMNSSAKSRRRGVEAIQSVPFDRLLAESDVHASRDVAVGTAGAISYLASALGKPANEIARQTGCNGIMFLKSSSSCSTPL